jgi:CBS domain-containing membrane protein
MLASTIGTLVTYNPTAVTPSTTLAELRQIMQKLQVRHLPVVDHDRHVVGLVSERDLARAQYNAAVTKLSEHEPPVDNHWVEQIMARHVTTIEQDESPEIALRAMVAHNFHSVPVTDNGQLVGMITSTDFLREISYGDWAGHDEPVRRRMGAPGRTVDAEASLERVLEIAEQHSQEFVVVVRRDRPLGVLSRTALRDSLYGSDRKDADDLRSTPVRAVLPTLPALVVDMVLGRAASLMMENRARALPVVDKAKMLLGLLQEDDILRAMVERIAE